jgi:hypothetical protein
VVGGSGLDGFWILGRRGAEEMGFGCTADGKEMGKRKKKTDLKTVHSGLKPSTFDRTRVGVWVCVCVIRSNLHKQVRMYACSAVRV